MSLIASKEFLHCERGNGDIRSSLKSCLATRDRCLHCHLG
jgi:hypothetical protein